MHGTIAVGTPKIMRTPIAYALLAFAAPGLVPASTASAQTTQAKGVAASDAWIRLNPAPGRPSAGYVTLKGGAKADTLLGATAPGARIELHSMSMDGGVMRMAKLDKVAIPAGGTASFAPGGNHLMIFGLSGTAKTLPITFEFAGGAKVTITAAVKTAGDDMHAGH
jgi:copper(I)-binding protein